MASRATIFGSLAIAVAAVIMGAGQAVAQVDKPPLTMVSFGGAFTRSQMLAYVVPYREAKGRWVDVQDYTGGLDEIRRQVRSANPRWDVVSLELPDAVAGCAEGLLEPIDHGILAPAPDGTPASADFYDVALQECAVGFDVFATVIAYDEGRFAQPPVALAEAVAVPSPGHEPGHQPHQHHRQQAPLVEGEGLDQRHGIQSFVVQSR